MLGTLGPGDIAVDNAFKDVAFTVCIVMSQKTVKTHTTHTKPIYSEPIYIL